MFERFIFNKQGEGEGDNDNNNSFCDLFSWNKMKEMISQQQQQQLQQQKYGGEAETETETAKEEEQSKMLSTVEKEAATTTTTTNNDITTFYSTSSVQDFEMRLQELLAVHSSSVENHGNSLILRDDDNPIFNKTSTSTMTAIPSEQDQKDINNYDDNQGSSSLLLSSSSSSSSCTQLNHCKQLEMWDCGVACLLMIRRWLLQQSTLSLSSTSSSSSQQPPLGDTIPSLLLYPENSTLLPQEMDERDAILKRIGATSIWTAELVLELHDYILPSTTTTATTTNSNDNKNTSYDYSASIDFAINNNNKNKKSSNNYLFCSKTLQVELDHQDLGYYRSEFGNDKVRVNGVFQKLYEKHASMMCLEKLPLQSVLKAVVQPNCVAIVLVDNHVLINYYAITASSSSSLLSNKNGKRDNGSADSNDNDNNHDHDINIDATDHYQGHYVILCGISREKDHLELATEYDKKFNAENPLDYCLVLCNPNRYTPWMYVTPDRFEASWRSNGTDDDIIFIFSGMREREQKAMNGK